MVIDVWIVGLEGVLVMFRSEQIGEKAVCVCLSASVWVVYFIIGRNMAGMDS